ncbi:MAG TPA: hypothetical protein VLL94_07010, partial [Nitrospiraceae bacterium]|nr:hypothetical protein [Nitrospiraceae bacterium]
MILGAMIRHNQAWDASRHTASLAPLPEAQISELAAEADDLGIELESEPESEPPLPVPSKHGRKATT